MMQRLIRVTQRALGLHHPGRNLKVWPDDVFILSFPKSGNTWTRFLIANLAYPGNPGRFFQHQSSDSGSGGALEA